MAANANNDNKQLASKHITMINDNKQLASKHITMINDNKQLASKHITMIKVSSLNELSQGKI